MQNSKQECLKSKLKIRQSARTSSLTDGKRADRAARHTWMRHFLLTGNCQLCVLWSRLLRCERVSSLSDRKSTKCRDRPRLIFWQPTSKGDLFIPPVQKTLRSRSSSTFSSWSVHYLFVLGLLFPITSKLQK